MRIRWALVVVSTLALLASCGGGSDDDAAGDDGPAATDVPATDPAGSDDADQPPNEPEPDPCVTDLQVVNADAESATSVPDGAFEAVTMWAEEGPHPDNTVDYDQSLGLGFFTYEQAPDPQFGVAIPIDADTPDGEHFVSISLFDADEAIAAGSTFVDQLDIEDRPDADGEINFSFWEYGSTRLLPGAFEVTITELTDERVCGEITTVTETELQQFIGLEGTFVADRSQHLEAQLQD